MSQQHWAGRCPYGCRPQAELRGAPAREPECAPKPLATGRLACAGLIPDSERREQVDCH